MHRFFRLILLIWVVGFLIVSCGPILAGDTTLGAVGLLTGAILFIPWLAGIAILGTLVWFTNPRR
jgi:hypothetical protein